MKHQIAGLKLVISTSESILSISEDEKWMSEALIEANKAEMLGEVPVGAVVVFQNQIIGRGHNQPIKNNDPSAHAEIMALRNAGEFLSNYRLPNATLYVTLEPCVMCVGAIIHARISRVVYGATDPKTGAATSVLNLFDKKEINHHTSVHGGVLVNQSSNLLRTFFKNKRIKN